MAAYGFKNCQPSFLFHNQKHILQELAFHPPPPYPRGPTPYTLAIEIRNGTKFIRHFTIQRKITQ